MSGVGPPGTHSIVLHNRYPSFHKIVAPTRLIIVQRLGKCKLFFTKSLSDSSLSFFLMIESIYDFMREDIAWNISSNVAT